MSELPDDVAPVDAATRPMQMALLEGDERPVGPLLTSVFAGLNGDLIRAVAPLYLTGSVLDTTYGRGMWWTRLRPETLVAHDIELDGVDFRHLPHDDASFDTVCFDPPYVPRQGPNTAAPHEQEFRDRFGLAESRSGQELRALILAGLEECTRVARRWLLVKCNDYVNGRQFHLGHHLVLARADELGIRCHDLIVHHSGTGPGGSQIKVPLRARRAHSYLLVFDVRPYHRGCEQMAGAEQ
jgi:hypothetical protein